MANDYIELMQIYSGSDGARTKGLYDELAFHGPAGAVGLNLFRASKTSTRAKEYRRRSHREESYGRKQWAMENVCKILALHAASLSIVWGWAIDEDQPFHRYVLYVDLPTGQVSFHTSFRGDGPDYPGKWDQMRNVQAHRICKYIASIMVKA